MTYLYGKDWWNKWKNVEYNILRFEKNDKRMDIISWKVGQTHFHFQKGNNISKYHLWNKYALIYIEIQDLKVISCLYCSIYPRLYIITKYPES